MTEHVATTHPPAEHPPAEPHEHHGHHNDPESIAKEKRKYLIVFGMLGVLTILTVAAAEMLHLPPMETVLVALAIALVKGTLVAAVFMHLISERKLIYAVLVLTVFFFGVMIWGPWHHRNNAKDTWPSYDQTNDTAATSTATGTSHGPAGQH
jgi:cytochrome c oxidase subunit IV